LRDDRGEPQYPSPADDSPAAHCGASVRLILLSALTGT
jgi:hypothetical protein